MTKLAIVQEREEDKYDHRTVLRCWKCDEVNGKAITADEATVRVFVPPFSSPIYMRAVLADAAFDRWDHAVVVVRPSVRGQGLGRRDHPLRAYVVAPTAREWAYSR